MMAKKINIANSKTGKVKKLKVKKTKVKFPKKMM